LTGFVAVLVSDQVDGIARLPPPYGGLPGDPEAHRAAVDPLVFIPADGSHAVNSALRRREAVPGCAIAAGGDRVGRDLDFLPFPVIAPKLALDRDAFPAQLDHREVNLLSGQRLALGRHGDQVERERLSFAPKVTVGAQSDIHISRMGHDRSAPADVLAAFVGDGALDADSHGKDARRGSHLHIGDHLPIGIGHFLAATQAQTIEPVLGIVGEGIASRTRVVEPGHFTQGIPAQRRICDRAAEVVGRSNRGFEVVTLNDLAVVRRHLDLIFRYAEFRDGESDRGIISVLVGDDDLAAAERGVFG